MSELALESADLSPAQIKLIQTILREYLPGREVVAFGSRVNGRARAFLDLDLAVMGDTPLPMSQLGLLRDAFDNAALPWPVDIVDWSTTSDTFRSIIKAAYAIVQTPS